MTSRRQLISRELSSLAGRLVIADDVADGRYGQVPLRRYSPAADEDARVPLVWVHGGGFVNGGLDQLESHAVAIAVAAAGRKVVAVDYRRVPMWNVLRPARPGVLPGVRYPLPLEDVIDAFELVRAETVLGRVALGGASAGACLSAAAALRLASENRPGPDSLLLAYGIFHAVLPPIDDALRSRTTGRHALAQFRPGTVTAMNRNYAGSAEAMSDRYAFPGGHDVRGLPRTTMVDADRDTLRASGSLFARELREAGVQVDYSVVPDAPHGFLDKPARPAFGVAVARLVAALEDADGPGAGGASSTMASATE